jgi:hypothetical protein
MQALNSRQLGERIRQSGLPYETLGRTALGREILCVELGGTKDPPIVITAGSHAPEWAGPLAALELLQTIETGHRVYLVPCRDPLGLDGFCACASEATAAACSGESMAELWSLIEEYGEMAFDQEGIHIATFGEIGAIVVDESQIRQFVVEQHYLPEMVPTRPDLIKRLAGRYLFFVERWEEGWYGWRGSPLHHPAEVLYVSPHGATGNLNRFFDREDAPVEVACIRDLIDRVKPGLVLDLHEGFSDKFYLVVPLSDDPLQDRIARAMAATARDLNVPLATFDELAPLWGPKLTAAFHDLGDGIYSGDHMNLAVSLGSYGRRYGATVTTEAGMDAPIEQRVRLIARAARTAIAIYEAHFRSRAKEEEGAEYAGNRPTT